MLGELLKLVELEADLLALAEGDTEAETLALGLTDPEDDALGEIEGDTEGDTEALGPTDPSNSIA